MESPSNPVALPVEQNLKPQEPNPASNELSTPVRSSPNSTAPHQAPHPQPEGVSALSLALSSALKNQRTLSREERTTYLGALTSESLDSITRVVEQYLPSLKPDLNTLHNLLTVASQTTLTPGQAAELREIYDRTYEKAFPE